MDNINWHQHISIAKFLQKDIDINILEKMIEFSQKISTVFNRQNVSIIQVKDKVRKSKIAEIMNDESSEIIESAPVIFIYVVDFYKVNKFIDDNNISKLKQVTKEELLLSFIDIGMILSSSILYATSSNLSVYPVNKIKANMINVSKILNLPKYVLPVEGLCVGYSCNITDPSPKLPLPTFLHEETYQESRLSSYLNKHTLIPYTHLSNCLALILDMFLHVKK